MKRAHLLDTDGFNQLAKGRDVYYLYNRHDVFVGRAIEKYGEYSGLEMKLLEQICSPDDYAIEVGANIGALTIAIAKRVGRRGRVLAFEPQRLVFQTLCANVALNSLENVDCYWCALGRSDGVITVPELDPNEINNFGGLSLDRGQQGQPVDCFTLDRYLALPRLRLIKVDVEGMEADVLSGGLKIIDKFKPLLYVENDRVESSENLIRLIDSLGYRLYWHTPPLFNPGNFYGDLENIYPGVGSINMICVHRETHIKLTGFNEIQDFSSHPLRR